MLNKRKELEALMQQCYCSEHIYTTMIPNFYYTDGVKVFCENAEAYWFLSDICSYMIELWNKDDFFAVTLSVEDEKGTITIDDGDRKTYVKKEIIYTDCPEGDWKFYIERSEDGYVLLYYMEH